MELFAVPGGEVAGPSWHGILSHARAAGWSISLPVTGMHDEDGWKHGFTNRVALVVALIRKLTEHKYALHPLHRSPIDHVAHVHGIGTSAVLQCAKNICYTRGRARLGCVAVWGWVVASRAARRVHTRHAPYIHDPAYIHAHARAHGHGHGHGHGHAMDMDMDTWTWICTEFHMLLTCASQLLVRVLVR